jgi:hypothetical protein
MRTIIASILTALALAGCSIIPDSARKAVQPALDMVQPALDLVPPALNMAGSALNITGPPWTPVELVEDERVLVVLGGAPRAEDRAQQQIWPGSEAADNRRAVGDKSNPETFRKGASARPAFDADSISDKLKRNDGPLKE